MWYKNGTRSHRRGATRLLKQVSKSKYDYRYEDFKPKKIRYKSYDKTLYCLEQWEGRRMIKERSWKSHRKTQYK